MYDFMVYGYYAKAIAAAFFPSQSEFASPGRKGFYTSWQSGSQQIAVVFAATLGALLNKYVSGPNMTAWGWRIPLLIGCVIIPFVFIIRRSLTETDEFLKRKHHPKP